MFFCSPEISISVNVNYILDIGIIRVFACLKGRYKRYRRWKPYTRWNNVACLLEYIVLKYLNNFSENTELLLQQLLQRFVILLSLLLGERGQTITILHIDHMSLNNDKCTFSVTKIKNVASRLPPTTIRIFLVFQE